MRLLIFSRRNAQSAGIVEANCTIPYIWISFRDPDLQPANLPDHSLRKDALFLACDDCDEKEHGVPMENPEHDTRSWIAMQPDQAQQIVDFVNKWKDKVDLICVNCEAGISRSSGCAAAISIWLNNHDSGIGGQDYYHPNAHVKSLILRTARGQS